MGDDLVTEIKATDVERMEFQLALRRRGISDQAVLRAMDEVPREHFVAAALAESAYADQALPIACGQTISQPYVVAFMTEQLDVEKDGGFLRIGLFHYNTVEEADRLLAALRELLAG